MKKIEKKSMFFKALGEPNRLKIIQYLIGRNGCTCICKLGKVIKKDQSVAFRHIKILESAGIVSTYKEAKFLMCCIEDKKMIRKYLEG